MRVIKLSPIVVARCVASAKVAATLDDYEALEKAAKGDDYQAQRNVAYWLSGGYGGAPPLNPILACAWRIVTLESCSPGVDASDVSNKQFYCGEKKLDSDGLKAAHAGHGFAKVRQASQMKLVLISAGRARGGRIVCLLPWSTYGRLANHPRSR